MTRSESETGPSDEMLVARSLEGDRAALSALVARHGPFVYNLAFKTFGARADAEDVTQEVLTKVVTSLGTFRGASAFTTWLYRITVNHCLRSRRRGREIEIVGAAEYFDGIAQVPDPDEAAAAEEIAGETIDELRVRCTSGMLLCLERDQRMVYVLGAVLGLPQATAAAAMGLSPGHFRVRLHRARADLREWMRGRCGLVDPSRPCRCDKKARAYLAAGLLDPRRLVFTRERRERVDALVRRDARRVMAAVDDLDEVFRAHPAQANDEDVVARVLDGPELRDFFFSLDG